MNIFNIIGPRMIGPSSSHTAGAVRLGRVANKIMHGDKPKKVTIQISGSFATTYKGHGTDRALIAGILGYDSDDIEIRDIFEIAKEQQLEYQFIPTNIPDSHPNTARIMFECHGGRTGEVLGASVGGGNIRIYNINGMNVDFAGDNSTILVIHNDTPGVIAEVTNLLRKEYKDMNICDFNLTRREKGGEALMTIELDNPPPLDAKEKIQNLDNVNNVIVINKI